MPHLALCLLGSTQINLKGAYSIHLRTDKARALLAYLAVEVDRPHRREELASMLWPDRSTQAALSSLRQELYSLRKALSDHGSGNPYILFTNHEIQFNSESDYWLDVAEFMALIDSYRSHHPENDSVCENCVEKIRAAIELYKGDFLRGFSLPNCISYDWWQLSQQEVYHHAAIDALSKLVIYYESRHDYLKMSNYAQKKIELEPWWESAHRQRMRALALAGQIAQALRQYEICRDILSQEFGLEPTAETTRLYWQIRQGTLPSASNGKELRVKYRIPRQVALEHIYPNKRSTINK